jgi:dihydroneopterin aldolase
MGIIKIENIRVFAQHGCLKEETKVGSDYRVDLKVKADLQKSASSDKLEDTVDYVFLNTVVVEEMAIPSALLEHVAKRILKRIFTANKQVTIATIAVSKINPPIGGDVEMVTVEITEKRKSPSS